MRLKAFLALPMTLWLTGCATGPFDTGPAVVVRFVCLKNAEYDKPTQDRASIELAGLQKDSALRKFVGDYVQQRDKVRECNKRAQEAK